MGGLSLNLTLLVSKAIYSNTPVLLNFANLSLLVGGSDTDTINADNTTTYEVLDLPAWATVNSSTGEISVVSDSTAYGEERFNIRLTNEETNKTFSQACKIQLFRDQANVAGKFSENVVSTTNENITLTSVSSSGGGLLYDKVNNHWKVLVAYYSSYSINNQLKVVNLTTNSVEANLDGFLEGTPLNAQRTVVVDSEDTYIRFSPKLAIHNANTGVITEVGDLPSELGGNILYPSMVLGMDGKLVLGGELSGVLSIAEYDTTLGTYTVWNDLNNGDVGANRDAVADTTHLYQTTNGNGTGYRLYTMDRATSTGVKLANCPTWVSATQGKYGCWVYIPSGSTQTDGITPIQEGFHWLLNGSLTFATNGLNQDTCPWDNQGEPFEVNTASPIDTPYSVDVTGIAPAVGSSNANVWHKDLVSSDWVESTIDNISLYSIPTYYLAKIASQLISIGEYYNGVTVTNLANMSQASYTIPNLSYRSHFEMNGKLYFSGYPSGALYEYDPTLTWDNTSGSYDPNGDNQGTNPKFIGYTRYDSPDIGGISIGGTGGGHHNTFVMLDSGDGLLWCFGQWERDGTGLGITSVDTNDSYRMVGYRDASMEEYKPRKGCATNNYLVCLCEGVTNPDKLSLAVVNKTTRAIKYIDLPTEAVLKWTNLRVGSSIISYGADKVCVSSANSSNEAMLIGVDVATDSIVYSNTLSGSFTLDGGSMELMSDGNVYLGIDAQTVLVDPTSGWAEAVNTVGIKGHRLQANDGKVYLANYTNTYSIDDPFMPQGFGTIDSNQGDFFDSIVYFPQGTAQTNESQPDSKSLNLEVYGVGTGGDNEAYMYTSTTHNLSGGASYTLKFNANVISGTAVMNGWKTLNVGTWTPLSHTITNGLNVINLIGDGSGGYPLFSMDVKQLFNVEISNMVLIDDALS